MPKKEQWDEAVGDAPWAGRIPPAPGGMRVVQAFVNTADFASARDELAGPAALEDFLRRWKLLPADAALAAADVERARTVREDLRALLRSNVGKALDPAVAARLDREASGALLRVRFGSAGDTRLEPAAGGLDAALGGLFAAVARARLDGRWPRFKACAGDDCGLCFYDASNNRTRRFCTLRCSNRDKARTFRRRRPGYNYYRGDRGTER